MSSAIPFWRDSPLVWDHLKINGKAAPGLARVTFKSPARLDVRKPPKAHYAVLVDQGKPPLEGTITLEIGFDATAGQPFGSGASQWSAWLDLEQSIFGKKPSKRNAFTVSHPEFSRRGVNKVYLGDPGPLEGDGPGTRKITIPWWEFGKIVSAEAGTVTATTAKPIGSISVAQLATAKKPSSTETGP